MSRGIGSAIVCVLMAAAVLTGCGSDSSTASITKAQFVKQANKLCTKELIKRNVALEDWYHKEVHANFGAPIGKALEKKIALAALLPPMQKLAEELSELGAPSGDEDQIDALVQDLEDGNAVIEEDATGVLTTAETPYLAFEKGSVDYKLARCALI